MSLKTCSLVYLPPPGVCQVEAFRANLEKYPPAGELVTYSEHPWPNCIRLKGSPEIMRGASNEKGKVNRYAINNMAFFTGLRIAKAQGYSHVLYLETDCRVGCAGWDQRIFEEFFSLGRPCVVGGSTCVYNPLNCGLAAARKWEALVAGNVRRNFPIATYGFLGADKTAPSIVFCNGAFSVLDIAWMSRLFDLDQTGKLAANCSPWDMALGQELSKHFEPVEVYELVGHLSCVYSGYGNSLTTPEERQELLTSGKVVGIHPIKDQWVPS